MKITIYCVGKLKEDYWKEAVAEYLKRLQPYAKTEIVEVGDLPTPEGASEILEEEIKAKEDAKILAKLKPSDYLITLDLKGKEYDSVSFSKQLEKWFSLGGSNLSFVIGGSLGLSKELKERANASVRFGPMTFPHQLARVMLLEQLYRAFKIQKGEPYHK